VTSWRKKESERLEAAKMKLLAAADAEGAERINAQLKRLPFELPPSLRKEF
jgi:hypothetical protein